MPLLKDTDSKRRAAWDGLPRSGDPKDLKWYMNLTLQATPHVSSFLKGNLNTSVRDKHSSPILL
jgi:hypothetical protein